MRARLRSAIWLLLAATAAASELKLDQESNGYTGLTFTFDPRLDKHPQQLQFEHWQSVMQQSSLMLYEALNGRAHLQELRVLIPYKWRHLELIHKPGAPVIMNRLARYSEADFLVGFEGKLSRSLRFATPTGLGKSSREF